jgi:hypothetical protein
MLSTNAIGQMVAGQLLAFRGHAKSASVRINRHHRPTPITVLMGKDDPAAVVPVRFGEDVIVGLLPKPLKLFAGCAGIRWAGSPLLAKGKGNGKQQGGMELGNRQRFGCSIPPAQRTGMDR